VCSIGHDDSTRCVLIVEDDDDTRDSMRALLETQGYDVQPAINGADALARLRAGLQPCVILLDLMMPVMDGFEFRVVQRADPLLADIPVIAYSGHYDVAENAARLGTVAYFQKPVAFEELISLVAVHC
jgi:CheY-like chemotaxis protein